MNELGVSRSKCSIQQEVLLTKLIYVCLVFMSIKAWKTLRENLIFHGYLKRIRNDLPGFSVPACNDYHMILFALFHTWSSSDCHGCQLMLVTVLHMTPVYFAYLVFTCCSEGIKYLTHILKLFHYNFWSNNWLTMPHFFVGTPWFHAGNRAVECNLACIWNYFTLVIAIKKMHFHLLYSLTSC